ncbi:TM2 domain-containing protein [Rhodobacter capsulatus]|uniref:TM2 domain-containing protein n=1 Tax=Rhodobacter capsulatus TaxID=1061 RepID=UPI0003D3A90A|nr:TM2 domain-containing protein [Rhodobacter capsulatus]ETD88999.1 membrane protein [Rhodobacter capsulatus YW2]
MTLTTEQLILVEQRLANDKKSTLVAYLLWFFLGGFGVHRFYLGKSGSGAIMLVLMILGWLTAIFYVGFAFLLVVAIWMIVDAFLIPGMITDNTTQQRLRLQLEMNAGMPAAAVPPVPAG